MTTNKDPESVVAATPTSHIVRQTAVTPTSHILRQAASRQQSPSESYFSASPSPPPSTPPPPPPVTRINDVPFLHRVNESASRRRKLVQSAFLQFEEQASAHSNGQPIPALTASAVKVHDFLQQSSSENAVERFCVWDWVDDPNVVHARVAMAEIEQKQDMHANIQN